MINLKSICFYFSCIWRPKGDQPVFPDSNNCWDSMWCCGCSCHLRYRLPCHLLSPQALAKCRSPISIWMMWHMKQLDKVQWVVDVDEDINFFFQTNEWLIGFLLQMMVGINRIFKVNRIFVKVDFISYNSKVVVLLYSPVTLMCAIQINGPSF